MISTVLVVGGSDQAREKAIADSIANSINALNASPKSGSHFKSAVLFEGLANGSPLLQPDENTIICRIASGCICCNNNMVMRVYLNRLIQQNPNQLFLSLSSDLHLRKIKDFLSVPSYMKVLELTTEINLKSINSQRIV